MLFDVGKHPPGGKELRIASYDSFALFAAIRVEYEITEQLDNAAFCEGTGNHREQRTDAVGNLIRIHLPWSMRINTYMV